MYKFFKYFIIIIFFSWDVNSEENNYYKLVPEVDSNWKSNVNKKSVGRNFVIVSANKYATLGAKKILELGGNAVDASVTLQLILGLVEPQSSGLGGGSFALYFDKKSKKVFNYDGRESAPEKISPDVFLDKFGKPKKFFDAALGGQSVGVPGTLETLFKMHKEFGLLNWNSLIQPVIELSEKGFVPPKRLIKSLTKEKFLWNNISDDNFLNFILEDPNELVRNYEYSKTLKEIAIEHRDFYEGRIANKIISKVRKSKLNPGILSHKDMSSYKVEKTQALCTELSKFKICGPQLPSSGGIAITQALILFENYKFSPKKKVFQKIQDIMSFIYNERDLYLADSNFEKVNEKKLLNRKYLIEKFRIFLTKKEFSEINASRTKFNSTSHFSIYDKFGNNLTMTSSIENRFGSRIFVEGFFLNNQLTDFSFKNKSGNIPIKNRVAGGKKPLSSMTPIIILDKNDNFLFSTGSPGGIAIISYVLKSIIDIMYLNLDPLVSISQGNFVRKSNKLYLEKNFFNIKQIQKHNPKSLIIKEIPLTSGLAVIKKDGDLLTGYADFRRDGITIAK